MVDIYFILLLSTQTLNSSSTHTISWYRSIFIRIFQSRSNRKCMYDLYMIWYKYIQTYIYIYVCEEKYIYVERKRRMWEIYFNELSHMIMKAGNYKVYRWAGRLMTQRNSNITVQVSRLFSYTECPLAWGCHSFVLLLIRSGGALPDWSPPNLIYLKPTILNVNLIPEHPHRHIHNR